MASVSLVLRVSQAVGFVRSRSCVLPRIRCSVAAAKTATTCLSRKYSDDAAKGRLFSKKHEWVDVDGHIGTVGISHYAQEALGDVVYAQLPQVGTHVERDEEVGALESVKAASELYSPLSGNVCSVNSEVEQSPGIINQDCYSKGWLFKLTLTKTEELDDLMTEKQYQQFLLLEQAAK